MSLRDEWDGQRDGRRAEHEVHELRAREIRSGKACR